MDGQLVNIAVNAYFVMAVGYNLLSLAWIDWRRRPLAPTDPVQGIVIMALLYLIHSAKTTLGATAWTLLTGVFLLLILRFGIYRHWGNYNTEDYASKTAWITAIAINVYGVLVLLLALLT